MCCPFPVTRMNGFERGKIEWRKIMEEGRTNMPPISHQRFTGYLFLEVKGEKEIPRLPLITPLAAADVKRQAMEEGR